MKHRNQLEDSALNLDKISAIKNLTDNYSHLGEDYIVSKITSGRQFLVFSRAHRFDGMKMLISAKGTVKMTIGLDECTIGPNSVAFIYPETVFKPLDYSRDGVEVYVLFLSNRFIHDINIDLNAINTTIFTARNVVMRLSPDRIELLLRYFELLHLNALSQSNYTRYIARAIASAAGYQLMAFGEEAAEKAIEEHPHSRKMTYVRNFLQLVKTHHRSQRAIGFYAEKMFISPKYLSLIIKESTGRSAAEWIDQYVLQEAKNLLRYSGKNVQQIAYELNFTNQSSFGKYFKHLTGLSPTQFQNS